jgi:hypothetical protein
MPAIAVLSQEEEEELKGKGKLLEGQLCLQC